MSNSLNPKRTVTELAELRALTGNENGAQRVAFTDTWLKARGWLRQKVARDLPGVEIHNDAAGNTWITLRGESPGALLMGGHIDSVPNGGWLDGCLNVLAGVEILRRIHDQYKGKPPITVRVVDWADEEGARFGKSLFGSSACSGNLDMNEARGLVDKAGIKLPDALKNVGIDFERVKDSGAELKNAAAYLELHIEQGPVLLDLGLPLGAVLGTFGVERHAITFHGQAAHSGSTPMNRRKDAFLAAAKMSPEMYRVAERNSGTGILPVSPLSGAPTDGQPENRSHHSGVCTIGSCTTKPGIVTSVVEECRITLDQRHLDATALAKMLQEAKAASEKFAVEGNVKVSWERLWQIAPRPFNDELIDLCDEAIRETCGKSHRLPSGPLHDAAEVAAAGVPTVMMFVQSLHGISHNKIEDTKEEHLEMCVTAFDKLADKAMGWIQKKS
ncbi:MAG TPA: hydantoinase/carbamoylase family amidase [Verrucomicrobiae bacterium]|nr:hydantoinase/carbamoylase family amidase [Verrucomicrobiae bacterium]